MPKGSVGVAAAVLWRELRTCSSVPPASEAALAARDPGLIEARGMGLPALEVRTLQPGTARKGTQKTPLSWC